jgi:tRNA-2-methylthio-N6-dimethylallyladenosine synthase
MVKKRLYINTMGCQMNVYDSGQICNRLSPVGYEPTSDLTLADLIIVNTCSIRAKAEQKAFSFLGRLVPLKERNPGLIIGIGGCVAQQEGKKILSRMPHVDLVFGTHAIQRLPQHIDRIEKVRCRIVDVEQQASADVDAYLPGPYSQTDVSSFVTIMRGCDNYCSYCVVPYVRGRESSRNPDDVLAEIGFLVNRGVREVTLLGQNVNSYGKKERLCSFSQLLERVNRVEGLKRIRFTTSHPKDLGRDLIEAFGALEKLCHHIHLPVQSGSDRVLRRMNRRYTRHHYLEKISELRRACPQIAITSDIIVGFPGETNADFEQTLSLIEHVNFDGLFAFMYSDRPHAPAVRFAGKLSEQEKNERLQKVLNLQAECTGRKNAALVGTVQQVLVDGPGKERIDAHEKNLQQAGVKQNQWSGRTLCNKIVHFNSESGIGSAKQVLTGRLMDIMIETAMPHCLCGSPNPNQGAVSRQKEI